MNKKPTYYAIAHVSGEPKGVTGILAVTKALGRQTTQEWTGEKFATWEQAETEMVAKNVLLSAGLYQ
jgi:hypothetical protein